MSLSGGVRYCLLPPEIALQFLQHYHSPSIVSHELIVIKYNSAWGHLFGARTRTIRNVTYQDADVTTAKNLRLVCMGAANAFSPWDIHTRVGGSWMRSVMYDLIRENALLAYKYQQPLAAKMLFDSLRLRTITCETDVHSFHMGYTVPKRTILFPFLEFLELFEADYTLIYNDELVGELIKWGQRPANETLDAFDYASLYPSIIKPATGRVQRPAGESAQRPAGESAQRPAGESAQRPAGESAQRPAGESAQRPAGESAQRPAGESAQHLVRGWNRCVHVHVETPIRYNIDYLTHEGKHKYKYQQLDASAHAPYIPRFNLHSDRMWSNKRILSGVKTNILLCRSCYTIIKILSG